MKILNEDIIIDTNSSVELINITDNVNEIVRSNEIQNGLGKQFDPVYGQIMLDLIDEDKDYKMKEN